MRVFLTLFCFLSFSFGAEDGPLLQRESTEEGAGISFGDLVRAAYAESPELRAATHRWQAAVQRAPQEKALPDPVLGYGYFVERMDTRQVFRVEQGIPGWGKRHLRGAVADEGARVAAEALESAAADVRLRVIEAAANYLLATQALQRVEMNLEWVEQLKQVARQRYRAGEVSQADVLRLESEADVLRFEWRSWQERVAPLRAEVNAVIGRPPETPLPLIEGMPAVPDDPGMKVETIGDVIVRNPDLRKAEAEIRRAERVGELARRNSRPDLMVGVEFMDNRGMAEDEVMAMVSISVPIWQGRFRAQRREASANLRAARDDREALLNRRLSEARMALFRTQDAIRQVNLFAEALLPRARQTLEIIETDYKGGTASFLDLIEAQRKLLELELGWLQARTDAVVRSAQWERLVASRQQGGRSLGGDWEENDWNTPIQEP